MLYLFTGYIRKTMRNRQQIFDGIIHQAGMDSQVQAGPSSRQDSYVLNEAQDPPRALTDQGYLTAAATATGNSNSSAVATPDAPALNSKGCSTAAVRANGNIDFTVNNKNSSAFSAVIDDFSSDDSSESFEFDEEQVAAIEKSNDESSAASHEASFANGKNEKIVLPSKKSIQPQNFKSLTPVKLSFGNLKNQDSSLAKKRKLQGDKTTFNVPNQQSLLLPSDSLEKNNDINLDPKKTSGIKYENCVFHGNIINNFYCNSKDS